MYFNEKFIDLIITSVWILIGISLIIAKTYTKNVLFSILGTACLVTSISAYLVVNIFSLWPQYFYLEIAILFALSVTIFLSISKITKINKISKK